MASWNRLTYPRRLFLWLLAYSALLVSLFVMFQYKREKTFKAEELNSQLQLVNTYIINELEEGHSIGHMELKELHPFPELRVSIIDSIGEIIYDNSLDSTHGSNHLSREEIKKAAATGSGYTVRRHSESTGQTYFYSATKGDGGMIVRTAVPYSLSLGELLKADYGFLWFMGMVSLAMCVIGYFATRRIGQHITRLKAFAESAEKGDRISDTAPFPHDELGDISNNIVRLYANLQKAISDRDREHRSALHEQKEKERIKKQLTNNINHELKTPVTSIQVCVETLVAHDNLPLEKRRDFLNKCLVNIHRLRNLLNDVAQITRMDDGGKNISMEPLDLSDVINEAIDDCRPSADAKGIEIVCGINSKIPFTGNHTLMMSVFHNLIDNAVSYSGGSEIVIAEENGMDGTIVITVADNGSGVPEEHLPRLFERFYRIDKGRSRAAGGTGLGLSIVKNAVLLHGGTITIANRREGGLLFTLRLPHTPTDNL